jgi:hypothetical protein
MTEAGSIFEVKAIVACKNRSEKCCGFHYVLKNHPQREVQIAYADKHFIGGTAAAKILYGTKSK